MLSFFSVTKQKTASPYAYIGNPVIKIYNPDYLVTAPLTAPLQSLPPA